MSGSLKLKDVRKIWDNGTHSAFTDLLRFNDEWIVGFREASGHVPGTDGVVRLISSRDGKDWESIAVIAEEGVDLRGPHLDVDPDVRITLFCGASIYKPGSTSTERVFESNRSRVFFSTDGRQWTPPKLVSIENEWPWRLTWHKGTGYAVSRPLSMGLSKDGVWRLGGTTPAPATLWKTQDGIQFEKMLVLDVNPEYCPSESTIRFLSDDSMVILVRCNNGRARYGHAPAPYTNWKWTDFGTQVGGPNIWVLPDVRVVYSVRDIRDNDRKCVVGFVENGAAGPPLTLPSDEDCAYTGLWFENGTLYASYYSVEPGKFTGWYEGHAAIYWAEIEVQ